MGITAMAVDALGGDICRVALFAREMSVRKGMRRRGFYDQNIEYPHDRLFTQLVRGCTYTPGSPGQQRKVQIR